jgi:REP element-mobilizing transposase RayT
LGTECSLGDSFGQQEDIFKYLPKLNWQNHLSLIKKRKMKKKIRKHTQLSLTNPKGAGRKPMYDKGIRHTKRESIKKDTVLHLTLKIQKEKSGLKNKKILKILHSSIKKARILGLKIIHYTLEYDHVHLLVEASDKKILGKGMQSFGISFSKGINKFRLQKGAVFKTRYHFRKLNTFTEIKNALNYIMGNGIKHRETFSIITPYNSLPGLTNTKTLYPGFELMIDKTIKQSKLLCDLRNELLSILSHASNYHLRKLIT